jgi:branched-chain amino acid transport system substrate-binding protein
MRWMWVPALLSSLAGCGSGSGRDTIKIGMTAPLSGKLAQFGSTTEEVVRLAIDEINAGGGVNGKDLELVLLDDGTDSAVAAQNTDAFIGRGDVAAMIGPAFSGGSQAAMPAIKANHLVSISGSATAASLVTADDDGYYFMAVPNDNFQAIAMAKYLMEIASPPEDQVTLVYQTDEYGEGLAATFADEYTRRGGSIPSMATFPPDLATQAAIDALWSQIASFPSPMVVLITFSGDGINIIQKWDDSGELPALRWFFTDGVRDSNFVQSRPTALEGMRGTAPTHANNQVFSDFAAAYQERYGADITQEVFQANYYDAVHLLALSLGAQAAAFPGEPLGGEHLRDAMVQAGLDYDGASGPCNFDADGQAIGPIEVWQIAGGVYRQDQYFETTDLVP